MPARSQDTADFEPEAPGFQPVRILEVELSQPLPAIAAQLANQGCYFGSGHPYFFNTPDPEQQTRANAFTAWTSHDQMGAAFNLNMLAHLPGATVHNRYYTKRLIYDAIDFLDDGAQNNSVEGTLGSGPAYDFLQGTRS